MKRRGQLLSMDFLVAFVILSAAIGLFVQANERLQSDALAASELSNRDAETIADSLAEARNFSPQVAYCAFYSNGSSFGSCGSCAKNAFVARRLVECPQGACLLSVKTCS